LEQGRRGKDGVKVRLVAAAKDGVLENAAPWSGPYKFSARGRRRTPMA
jgi:hypothetical protein